MHYLQPSLPSSGRTGIVTAGPLVRVSTIFLLCVSLAGCLDAQANLVREIDVVFDDRAGMNLQLDFVRPEGDGPFPLVVCVHGGGWRAGSRKEYKGFQESMGGQGIASIAVQYRFAPQAQFPSQLDDVRKALAFVLADPQRFRVDSKRIIWMGGSAGGHLALLAGLEKSDQYTTRLIVNVAGPTDLRTFRSLPSGDEVLKRFVSRDSSELLTDLMGTADRTADSYRLASPVEWIRKDSPKVITFHGEKDDIVPITQARDLHEKLRAANVPETLIVAPTGGHDFGSWDSKERNAALLELVKEVQEAIKIKQND